MINSLYVFVAGSYVVADEWNSNFSAIGASNSDCADAIIDAYEVICFMDSDLTQVFNVIKATKDSTSIPGTSVVLSPNNEYYKSLSNGTDLAVSIPSDFIGEARIVIKTFNDRILAPIIFTYSGDVVWNNGIADWYKAGTKFVFIYVINGIAYIKMLGTEA